MNGYRCIFCGMELRFVKRINIYDYFLCEKCEKYYMRHVHTGEWSYLSNYAWESEYGKWIPCTKKIEEKMREKVIFS